MNKIVVNGNTLSIEAVYKVAIEGEDIVLPDTAEFKERLISARKFLEDYIMKGYPTYGVTTGFGDSCHNQINYKKAEDLQRALINFHGIGIGRNFSKEIGRAVVLCRLNSNVKGHSAVRPELADLLVTLVNKDIIPVIPELGSVGASGDLTPLSYVGAVLMGDRNVYYKGKIVSTKEAFKAENITPLVLKAKEGLAIMNGTSVMTAIASLAWNKAKKLANISDFLTAAATEIIRGNDVPFRRKVSEMKNHPGQIESAEYIYDLIKDSKLVYKYEDLLKEIGSIEDKSFVKQHKKIQDRYSIRCAPQINGVLRDTLKFTKDWIENEINSANDNPLVDVESGALFNTGNFYGGHISAACDYLRIAVANICDLSDKQAEILIDGKFNGLTENLIPVLEDDDAYEKGLRHGFKAAQISISALSTEAQFLAGPVSIHSRPTESLNQDKVSMGTISARKLDEQLDIAFLQVAIHLCAVCQAIDIVGKTEFTPEIQKVYEEVRKLSSFVENDRPLDKEVTAVAEMLKRTTFF
ncbi:MAG: hypothetical protein A2015_08355 [Spirochaetes bacterium GWF1_31_7]|nr:MAG: hypothetical protein A2Y30_08550 [Spirochaetes bacterium GWE1_32_154]OHD47159.1 MAG: hypothetical protein A2015_08355 [Spirochaetes bacterium GWF1_31_7]HBD94954.1 aromatic amino acid lyase [Spirochaetia bacterium]HBI36060.1 aromatic amino acid lyase [Spirochaetia bacterium]